MSSPLITLLAPTSGTLLDVHLGASASDAVAHLELEWLPVTLAGQVVGQRASLTVPDPFTGEVVVDVTAGRVQAVSVTVGIARERVGLLDTLEKDVKRTLRGRLGAFSKDALRDPRPHWVESADPPRLWMALRWVTPEDAWLKVVCQRA